ncbi:acyltransferase [Kribbella sp. NBC_01245]|nr:acyltransferase [Kribbella sp. NBC_01245]
MSPSESTSFPDQARDGGVRRLDYLPWEYAAGATAEQRERQAERTRELAASSQVDLADDAFIADSAAVFCDKLRMGARSYIGANAYVTGKIGIGSDSTINPFAVVRGRIELGDGVRIGAHASLLAFNRGTGADQPIFKQAHTSLGITVGDDVWIGSNAIILDGVTVGSHSIIGAGAVVTKDVDEWAVVVGNPARKLRDRRTPATTPATTAATQPVPTMTQSVRRQAGDLPERLDAFATRAREQLSDVLARCYDGERFIDRPGVDDESVNRAIRPWCDAVELSDLLLRRAPDGHSRNDLVRRLRSRQDPATGLIAPGDLADSAFTDSALDKPADDLSAFEGPASYHVLCVGYALQLLGSRFEHPIRAVQECPPAELEQRLEALPWQSGAWSAGAGVDAIGTAIARNLVDFGDEFDDGGRGPLSTLFGWLALRANPATGLWGEPRPEDGWLQPVNGFYRLTRGTYAQFGLPLPYPEAAIRTVLAHTQDRSQFTGAGDNACNTLDVIHPLWLVGKQTAFGRDQGRRWAEAALNRLLEQGRWVDGEGFAFAPYADDHRAIPGLQGTEMWLSITWLLADYLGHSDALGFRPRGVHRPEPLVI